MRAAIALGSNLPSPFGVPAANVREALRCLRSLGQVAAVSTFLETDPVGYTNQPRFLNAATLLETHLGPLDLLHGLLAIEQFMGRIRAADTPPKGPRVIDLDLLLYETGDGQSLALQGPELILPHPEMHNRRFVLEPLTAIAPTMRHPVLGRSVAELLELLNSGG